MGKYMESDEFVYILSGEKEETMKAYKRLIAGTAAAVMLALTCGGCGAEKEPVTITIWNYYNGEQLEAFNRMVQNFNDTVGKAQGITVESSSQGSVNDLETNVLNAAEGKVGAEELPNIFSGYADTAYELDQQGMVVDLNDYLTESEKSEYVEGYLTEGDFDGDGSIKIFPTAKATEVLYLNDTDWIAGADGYYYYNGAVDPKTATTQLFSRVTFSTKMGNEYQNSTVHIYVTAEAVQTANLEQYAANDVRDVRKHVGAVEASTSSTQIDPIPTP